MRYKKYTPQSLRTACRKYFASISRTVAATEMADTGARDAQGHVVLMPVKILNHAGEEILKEEFAIPPTISGLCRYLNIARQTWDNYCADPEYDDTTVRVKERLREWNEEQLLTRPGKDVRGIIFNLQNNYGYAEKREVELGKTASHAIETAAMSMSEKAEILERLKKEAFGEDA